MTWWKTFEENNIVILGTNVSRMFIIHFNIDNNVDGWVGSGNLIPELIPDPKQYQLNQYNSKPLEALTEHLPALEIQLIRRLNSFSV